jgi:hypothetical protein
LGPLEGEHGLLLESRERRLKEDDSTRAASARSRATVAVRPAASVARVSATDYLKSIAP